MLTRCEYNLDWIAISPNRHREVVSIAIKMQSSLPRSRTYSSGFWLRSHGRVFLQTAVYKAMALYEWLSTMFSLSHFVYVHQINTTLGSQQHWQHVRYCGITCDSYRVALRSRQCKQDSSRSSLIESRLNGTSCILDWIWIQCEHAFTPSLIMVLISVSVMCCACLLWKIFMSL